MQRTKFLRKQHYLNLTLNFGNAFQQDTHSSRPAHSILTVLVSSPQIDSSHRENQWNQFLKQNKKEYDRKLQLVCLYNLASAYHKQWILDECIPLVDKFIIMLKSTIQQEQSQGKSHYLFKMKHLLIRTQLQYCAILSQVGDHFKALKIAIEVSQSLKQFFTKGYNQVCRFLNKIHRIDSKKSLASSWGSDTDLKFKSINSDKVQFATNVLSHSKQSLNDLIKIETYDEVVKDNFQKICQQLIELKSKTYFWKDNPQNNIKLLRKELDQQKLQQQTNIMSSNSDGQSQQRNLLGIKKPKSWIEQITIAKIMVMSPINYLQFFEKDNVIFQFNYKNLVEKIILVSVTYFSLAIQLRFIETKEQKQKLKNTQTTPPNHRLNSPEKSVPASKQIKQTDKQMKKSEVFHLKSIFLLCKMVKENSAFLNHLVINYHKHYKQDLITIQEESSMAEYSHIYDRRSKSNSLLMQAHENQFILPEDDEEIDKQIVLSSPKKFPRQSAYFQDNSNEKIEKKKSPNTKKNLMMAFKKVNSKKDFDTSEDKSKKYMNSISISRNQASTNNVRQAKSARYQKYINPRQTLKDRTVKKISVGKMVTLGSPIKLGLETERQKDKSLQKQTSLNKFSSVRSFEKKSFSTRSIPSFSLGKISMNSTTLKHKKRRGQKSPDKQKFKLKDLKQSNEFKRADFKKKQKQEGQKLSLKVKDKKKQKLNNGLILLKQSSSNPNMRVATAVQEYDLDQDYVSIKQRSRKMDKFSNKR